MNKGIRVKGLTGLITLSVTLMLLVSCSLLTQRPSAKRGGPESFAPNAWLKSWSCLGPFDNADTQGLDKDWLVTLGGEGSFSSGQLGRIAELRTSYPNMKLRHASPNTQGLVDFIEVFGQQEHKVAYALAEFLCEEDGFTFMRVGSDDGVKVWINGQEVLKHQLQRGAAPDQEIVPVQLRQGINRCLVKVDQGVGAWGFYLLFSEITPQQEGVHVRVLEPLEPPLLLLGAQLPIKQLLTMQLLNSGTEAVEGVRIRCRSSQLRETHTHAISCSVGNKVEVSLPLRPLPGLKHGEHVEIELEARYPGGQKLLLTTVDTQAALAHPLLRAKTASVSEPFFIVQLSDPHIVARDSVLARVKTAERLEQAVREINRMKPAPDFVVVTGDILLDQMRGYPLYHEIMSKLEVPYLSVFGNHDKPTGLPAAHRLFSEQGLPPYYAFVHKGYWFIILDTVAESNPQEGRITEPQLEWLESLLGIETENPRLFFLHHDLFSGFGVTNFEQVLEVIESHPGEKWFIAGHWHADCFVRRGTQRHIITTATAYLGEDGRLKHDRQLPGYRLIHFKQGEITTQLKPLGKPPMPDPPFEEYYTPEEVREVLGE